MATTVERVFLAILAITLSLQPMMAAGEKTAPKANQISLRKTMSKSSEYVDKYAEAAMEQMRRYGIPASVTLAQGILESGSGQSELSRKGKFNSLFSWSPPRHAEVPGPGIKAMLQQHSKAQQ